MTPFNYGEVDTVYLQYMLSFVFKGKVKIDSLESC